MDAGPAQAAEDGVVGGVWIAATWGLACPLPRWVATLVAVIWMKSLGTPPPVKMTAVPGPGGM